MRCKKLPPLAARGSPRAQATPLADRMAARLQLRAELIRVTPRPWSTRFTVLVRLLECDRPATLAHLYQSVRNGDRAAITAAVASLVESGEVLESSQTVRFPDGGGGIRERTDSYYQIAPRAGEEALPWANP